MSRWCLLEREKRPRRDRAKPSSLWQLRQFNAYVLVHRLDGLQTVAEVDFRGCPPRGLEAQDRRRQLMTDIPVENTVAIHNAA